MLDNLFFYTMACYGLCQILMYGSIFNKPRFWLMKKSAHMRSLLSCALCTGFWCGLVIYPFTLIHDGHDCGCGLEYIAALPFGFYSSITCYILHLLTEILLAKAYPAIGEGRLERDEEGIDGTDYDI